MNTAAILEIATTADNINTVKLGDSEISVKYRLDFSDVFAFIRGVVDLCFSDGNDEYIPEVYSYAMRRNTLLYYTDLDIDGDISDTYEAVYKLKDLGVYNEILNHIDHSQLQELADAIEKKIEFRKQNISELNQKAFDDVVKHLNLMADTMESAFSGVDETTISKLASALSDGAFNEDKLIEAVKNDMRKNSHPENILSLDGK